MSSKAIVIKRNSGDTPKYDQLKALNPAKLVEYANGSSLSQFKTAFGKLDYLLVTGGHGDFVSGKPSELNGADISSAKTWISNMSGTFKAIILDTCFTVALTPVFLPFVANGGAVVSAYGTGEGWADGFSTANGARTVGDVLADIVGNVSGFSAAMVSSLSIAVKKPNNQLVYTANGGMARGANLGERDGMGMETDTTEELKQVDQYLMMNRITISTVTSTQLATMLRHNLTMTIA